MTLVLQESMYNQIPDRDRIHGKNIQLWPHQQMLAHGMIQVENNNWVRQALTKQNNLESKNTHVSTTYSKEIWTLTDIPGSGKSFAILGAIHLAKLKSNINWSPTLIVIPISIEAQWKQYLQDFGHLSYYMLTHYGDISRLYVDHSLIKKRRDVILTTSIYWKMICEVFEDQNIQFDRIVVDEVDSFQSVSHLNPPCNMIWHVSASESYQPDGLCLLCEESWIKRCINLPPPKLEIIECQDSDRDRLVGIIPRDKQFAVNALDFSVFQFHYNVQTVHSAKELMACIFKDDIYKMEHIEEQLLQLPKTNNEFRERIQKLEQERDEAQRRMTLIQERIEKDECAICLEKFDDDHIQYVTSCCKNVFGYDCISKVIERTSKCPMCRAETDFDNGFKIETGESAGTLSKPKPLLQPVDKLTCFKNLVQKITQTPNYKLLVFSNYGFNAFVSCVTDMNIKYRELNGTSRLIERAVEEYKNGQIQMLMIDSTSYGAGLNLEMTTDLIVLHKTQKYNQIVGRAQRMGRTQPLNIYRLEYIDEED